MKGRITLLIDHAQSGVISGEDGVDYRFAGDSLLGIVIEALLDDVLDPSMLEDAVTEACRPLQDDGGA